MLAPEFIKFYKEHPNVTSFILSFFLIFILITIWFHSGYIMASGEGGIQFGDYKTLINLFGQSWFPSTIGFSGTGITQTSLPFILTIFIVHNLYIPSVIIEASTFFILLLTGFLSIYHLAQHVFAKYNQSNRLFLSITASFFYLFNQVTMVLILNRFQTPYLFFYALYPLTLYIIIRAIEAKKLIYSVILVLSGFLLAMAYASMPEIINYWGIIFAFSGYYYLFEERNRQTLFFILKFLIVSMVMWICVNSWWLISLLVVIPNSPYLTQTAYNSSNDYYTLSALSSSLGNLSFVFRLMHHDFYIWMEGVWNYYYQSWPIIILTFIPPLIVFGSLLIKRKSHYYYFFLLASLFTIFAAKGIADPFGGIFLFLFTHFRIMEGFRNPFEKIMLILPTFYSILFAFGLFGLFYFIKRNYSSIKAILLVIIICIICFVILCIPIWTGGVFEGYIPPSNNPRIGYKVKVPSYYSTASKWLNSQKPDDFRVIALPLGGEGITYDWKYGYRGVELSNGIFDQSFISYCTSIQYLCGLTKDIEPLTSLYPDDLWKILPPLDVRYIMLRRDTNYKSDQMQNPQDIEKELNAANYIKKVSQFGLLTFYQGNPQYSTPKIFAANQGIISLGPESFITSVPLADYKKNDLYFTHPASFTQVSNQSHQIILQAVKYTPSNLSINKTNVISQLPYVSNLPGQPMYFFTRAKESFIDFIQGNSDFANKIDESDKRVVEVYKLLKGNNVALSDKAIQDYNLSLKYINQNLASVNQNNYEEDLLRQKYVMSDIVEMIKLYNDKKPIYQSTYDLLNNMLKKLSIEPYMPVDLKKFEAYDVSVPQSGKYTLYISSKRYVNYYNSDLFTGNIDNKVPFQVNMSSTQFTTIGMFNINKGEHQINLQKLLGINLINQRNLIISTVKNNSGKGMLDKIYTVKVKKLDSYGNYDLSFDYKVDSGNPFQLSFVEDTDLTENNKLIPHYSLNLNYTGNKNHWYHYETQISPRHISHSGKIEFYVYPGNNCNNSRDILSVKLCANKAYSKEYDIPSVIEVKNLSFRRTDLGDIFLVKNDAISVPLIKPQVTYTEQNPARYFIHIKNAKTPYYLAFLEAYDSLWHLYYIKGNTKIPVSDSNHLLVNSYANAWKIDKTGNYMLMLEFYPQEYFEFGIKVSELSLFILSSVLILYIINKIYRKNR